MSNPKIETRKDLLQLLIRNMEVNQENMDWIADGTEKRIIELLTETRVAGELDIKDRINALLDNKLVVNARKSVYAEVQEWAEAVLDEIEREENNEKNN